MHLLVEQPRTVSALAEDTGMSQPLVSQHLRTLRQAELATAQRQGREMIYRATDEHVAHVIEDALVHVHEPSAAQAETTTRNGKNHDRSPQER